MSKRWMRLDNAALIFPVIRRRNWSNAFRISATLTEVVDPALLQQAVTDLMPRFPSMYVRLRKGVFWYYLEELPTPPSVQEDFAFPLTLMQKKELKTCCLRVLYFQNRIAVECFHSLTDGTGGMTYLKTLTARYLSLTQGVDIPPEQGVLDWQEKPKPEELEDSFARCTNGVPLKDREPDALRLGGTPEPFILHLTTGILPTAALLDAAHRCGATATVFLAAVMAESILNDQAERCPERKRRKPVKITIPINLRKLYGSKTLRNFALTLNPGVDPRMGDYSLQELCKVMAAQLAAEATPQQMAGRIAANVSPQQNLLIRAVPLPIKSLIMRMVYQQRGESKGCINLSNLGLIRLPAEMAPWVRRMDLVIGTQRSYPNNCAVLSYGESTYISMIRKIRESELERRFFSRLVELGVPVRIESSDQGTPPHPGRTR
ncbi:MAG: alcohol acetyltransferase [Oscillospiraceae bacterium]|nr:alcohol acetyltransferase [Oscillospiraceae bacterium]